MKRIKDVKSIDEVIAKLKQTSIFDIIDERRNEDEKGRER